MNKAQKILSLFEQSGVQVNDKNINVVALSDGFEDEYGQPLPVFDKNQRTFETDDLELRDRIVNFLNSQGIKAWSIG